MDRLGEEVRREAARFGPPGGLGEVVDAWPAAVGPAIARNAWPARIARDGTLHVATSSSTWAYELAQLAPDLLARLRDALHEATPPALRFAPGRLPDAQQEEPAGGAAESVEPSAATLARAAELAAAVEDPDLRAAVARAAAASLERAAADRPF